jgi:hypothetical protein
MAEPFPAMATLSPDDSLGGQRARLTAPGDPIDDRSARACDSVCATEGLPPCAPQILRADLEMAGLLCVLVPQGTRTGENGRVLFPDAS